MSASPANTPTINFADLASTVVPVPLPQQAYNIAIAARGLYHLGAWLIGSDPPLIKPGQRLLLVSNTTVFDWYGQSALDSLTAAGFQAKACVLPDGEQYKTLDTVKAIYDAALDHQLERGSAMVALGGGVIGDMTGFAAATWLRGIAVVQVPTSLLAMVDASIGGKTGVNHPQGKNLIGAFHQPRLVLIDPTVLNTLPQREFQAGMAEVIKYGVIWDADLFGQLEATDAIASAQTIPADLLQTILVRSAQAKAAVVSQDEKEAGLRAILNYGHTIGHAVESLTGYCSVNHGEAVAIGMAAVGEIAVDLNTWSALEANRQTALIQKVGLPTQIPAGLSAAAILRTLQSDKKVKNGQVRFVLPEGIGKAFVSNQVTKEAIVKAIAAMVVDVTVS
ncbi:MAG: 3-dehydroquinate synthase [Cyanobacteria bacterium J06635_15]